MIPKLLIDGYNLLFQSQLVGKGRGRSWLIAARYRLNQLLTRRLTAEELALTKIVFDAPQFGDAPKTEVLASGLEIVYAVDHDEADDLIEEIIRQHPTPKQLRVISSDQRVRRCARARRACSISADDFLRSLEREPIEPQQEPASATAEQCETNEPSGIERLTETEIAFWLSEFQLPKVPPKK